MKKKVLLPLLASSLALVFGITACGGDNPSGPVNPEPKTARRIMTASLAKKAIEPDQKTKITCDTEGVTFRSSDTKIATVNDKGEVVGVENGLAYITLSKEGYFDRVLKVFVEDPQTIDYLVTGYEFGPAISGVKLNLPDKVKASDLANAQFTVKTNNRDRTVTSVNLCDEEGEIIDATESKYIRIDCDFRYSGYSVDASAACFTYSGMNKWMTNITASASLKAGSSLKVGDETLTSLTINQVSKRIVLSTKDWGEAKSHTAEGYTLMYKGYETDILREDEVLNPLVIWLHGQGEGGQDPDIALLGNDVTALGEQKIQSHFVKGQQKGAYVLAVQSPTMWMDNGNGQNHGGNAHSIYTKTLKSTIDKYIAENGDIDTNRIFVGGCSNGGYMTMEMAITYGNFFRAFYPCCEAYQNAIVTEEDIAKLKDLQMWFVHAANDRTVNPDNFTLGTYRRLMAAGAKDIHLSYFVNVQGKDGNPTGTNNYDGHWSWIYIFRDEVEFDQADYNNIAAPSTEPVKDASGTAMNLFDWMESKK